MLLYRIWAVSIYITLTLADLHRCRHLTDFVAVKKPTIAVCSASQMSSLSADDVFNKLRFLLSVIVGLFGCMNLGAGIAWASDVRQRSRLLKRVQGQEFGFKLTPGGAWTWLLQQVS